MACHKAPIRHLIKSNDHVSALLQMPLLDQIMKAIKPGIKVFELGNLIVCLPNGNHCTVLQLANNTMQGRNKLFKFIKSLRNVYTSGQGLMATVSIEHFNDKCQVEIGSTSYEFEHNPTHPTSHQPQTLTLFG